MTNPKQMNANYRRNERLLESNPTPINIGISDDVKEYIDEHSGGNYTAGTGIEITEENVVNNTAPVPPYTISDDDKILGVTVDSSGEEPVAQVGWVDKPSDIQYFIEVGNVDYATSTLKVNGVSYTPATFVSTFKDVDMNSTNTYIRANPFTYVLTTIVKTTADRSGLYIYGSRMLVDTTINKYYLGGLYVYYNTGSWKASSIQFAIPDSLPKELPNISSVDDGKVLTVNSGATGVEWKDPTGKTVVDITSISEIQRNDYFTGTILDSDLAQTAYCINAKVTNITGSSITFSGIIGLNGFTNLSTYIVQNISNVSNINGSVIR